MKRRRVLTLLGAGGLLGMAGCSGAPAAGRTTTTRDPFPDEVELAERGGAADPLIVAVQETAGYRDGSIECASRASDPFRAHLQNEIDTSSHLISTGYGRAPEGYDGMAISVHLTTTQYDRDGEVMATAETEFATLVDATPPAVYLRSESGEHVCAVPVYVDQGERYVD